MIMSRYIKILESHPNDFHIHPKMIHLVFENCECFFLKFAFFFLRKNSRSLGFLMESKSITIILFSSRSRRITSRSRKIFNLLYHL